QYEQVFVHPRVGRVTSLSAKAPTQALPGRSREGRSGKADRVCDSPEYVRSITHSTVNRAERRVTTVYAVNPSPMVGTRCERCPTCLATHPSQRPGCPHAR